MHQYLFRWTRLADGIHNSVRNRKVDTHRVVPPGAGLTILKLSPWLGDTMRELAAIENDHVSDCRLDADPIVGSFGILAICDMEVPC